MTVTVVTAPSVEPITLAEAKEYARVDSDDSSQDNVLEIFIQTAREYAENLTARAFVQRTLELALPGFPCEGVIDVPRPPLQSVTSITYIDQAGEQQTLDPALYQVDTRRAPGRVMPVYGEVFPATRGPSTFNAVVVRYVAGYPPGGSPADDYRLNLPAALKTWMATRINQHFGLRSPVVVGNLVTELKRDYVDGLLDALVVDVV